MNLSEHAKDISYEAWNSEKDLETYSLAEGLEKFSQACPPKLPSDNDNKARVKAYKLTLTRLLILVHTRGSDLSIDLRIWQLAGQLLTLAGAPDPRMEFAIKIRHLVIKGVLDFLIGGAIGGGGGNPDDPSGTEVAQFQGRPRNRWGLGSLEGLGKTLGCIVGLVTVSLHTNYPCGITSGSTCSCR